MFGLNMMVSKGKTVFIGDTSVNEYPSSEELADIAISSARVARLFGFDPKVAFLSHSTFGQPITSRTKHIRDAVEILKDRKVDFKFDGDMQPDVALNGICMRRASSLRCTSLIGVFVRYINICYLINKV